MKIKKALCLALAAVMTASLAAVPTLADTPSFGGIMTPETSSTGSSSQEFFDKISEMEYTAENVRLAVYALGVSGDMTYAFKELLNDDSLNFDEMASNVMLDVLAELGVKDMAGLADFMKTYTSSWQVNPISIVNPSDQDLSYSTAKLKNTILSINAGSNTPINSFSVSGATKGSNTYTTTSKPGDITIEAAEGYKLKNVLVSGTNMHKTQAFGGNDLNFESDKTECFSYFSDLVSDYQTNPPSSVTEPTSKVILLGNDLTRTYEDFANDESSPVGSRIFIADFQVQTGRGGQTATGSFTITVETEPKAKGTVILSGADSISVDGLYTFNGANYRSASALSTAINAYIARSDVNIGDVLSFSYNTTYINNVNVGNDIQSNGSDFTDGTVFFKVPENEASNNTITVTPAEMSKDVTIEAKDSETDANVAYTFQGNVYTGITALNGAIAAAITDTTPVGTTFTFTYAGDSISNITGSSVDSFSYNKSAKSVTFKTSATDSQKIEIEFVTMSKDITVTATNEPSENSNVSYTFNGTICHSATELQTALNGAMATTPAETQLSFTVTDLDNAISSITGSEGSENLNVRRSGNTVTFKTTSDEGKGITIAFKTKSQGVKINDNESKLPDNVTSVTLTVNGEQHSFADVTTLNKYISDNVYAGTIISLTFTLASGYSITDVIGGVLSGSNTAGQITLTSEDKVNVQVVINTSDPRLTVTAYATSSNDDLNSEFAKYVNGQVVIAEVTNASALTEDALSNAQITISVSKVSSSNKSAPESYTSTPVSITKNDKENYAGLVFKPKLNNTNILFDYQYDVNARLTYNGGTDTKTGSTTVNITGQPIE